MKLDELRNLLKYAEGLWPQDMCVSVYSLAKDIKAEGVILELGSYKGRVTLCLAKALEEKGEGKVYSIDANYFGSRVDFLRNIERFGIKDLVEPIFRHSARANIGWNQPIKLICIDIDDNYFSLKSNFILWERFLTLGGVIVLASIFSKDVKRFIHDYIIGSKRFERLTIIGSLAFAYKIKKTPTYPRLKIVYTRISCSLFYFIKKIIYILNLHNKTFFSFLLKDLSIKRVINRFLEKLLI